MTVFSFKYKQYGNRWLPIIPVKIKSAQNQLLTEALLDTGASISTFSAEIAEFLEIDYTHGKVVYPLGTSGHIKAYLVNVTLEIGEKEIHCPALFSKELVSKFNLLGMQGIFDPFKVTFDSKNKTVLFQEH